VLSRRQLLRRSLGALGMVGSSGLSAGLLAACGRSPGPALLSCGGAMPEAWLSALPKPWELKQLASPEAIIKALEQPSQPPGLLQLSDGWAASLERRLLQPLQAPTLLARLAAAAGPVSRLYCSPAAAPVAFPWSFSPWVLALRNRPELLEPARESWAVLLDPSLEGKLVLPSSPRLCIELMGADPQRIRQLRRQALAFDEAQGLNLLLHGDARAAVLPLQRLVPLLRRDPRLQVVLPASGAPLSWQLLLRPASSRTPLPMAWLEALLAPPLLPKLLAQGWVPPLPRQQLEPLLRELPPLLAALLLPAEAVLQRCWSLPPLPERQRLAWQTLWDAAAP